MNTEDTAVVDADFDVEEPLEEQLQIAIQHHGLTVRFKLTKDGCEIPEDMTQAEWVEGLRVFHWMQATMEKGFAIYVAFGEVKFGKDATHTALAQLEFPAMFVKAAIDLNSVPVELRLPGLDSDHFAVLRRSGLSAKQMRVWAEKASTQQLPANQLKASIDAGEVVSVEVARQRQTGVLSIKGIRQEMEIWLRRVNGPEGIRKMTKEVREDIIADLVPFHELYLELLKPAKRKPRKKKPAVAAA